MTDALVGLDELEALAKECLASIGHAGSSTVPFMRALRAYQEAALPEVTLALITELRAARAPVEAAVVTSGELRSAWLDGAKEGWDLAIGDAGDDEPAQFDDVVESCPYAGDASRAAPPADASACYCSDYQSSGLPCLPGKCPNVPKPPADEVAGLLTDLQLLRDEAHPSTSDEGGEEYYERVVRPAADRIENHLKGKR